jgi:SAM-dependent methyltransferase
VSDITSRLAELSPDKRRLLQGLLKAGTSERTASIGPRLAEAAAVRPDGSDPKRSCRAFFDAVNRSLDSTEFGAFSLFLNFGYVPAGGPDHAVVPVPEHTFSRNSVRLVLEVVGACPLEGRRVLDVGCGRGGTAAVVRQHFRPKQFVGIDLSLNAVAFSAAHQRGTGVGFAEADAERLPFGDGSMDVVMNIESSQSYPDIRRFFAEVRRVLVPRGDFLYTDVLPVQRAADWIGLLQSTGFELEIDRDITANVLLSCDEVARQRRMAYGAGASDEVMTNFLGAPGSHVYEEMKAGRWTYRIMRLRKSEP